MKTIYLGIDPGARPTIAVLTDDDSVVHTCRDMGAAIEHLRQLSSSTRFDAKLIAALEQPPTKVFLPARTDPKTGRKLPAQQMSQEKLYRSLGRLEGALMALAVATHLVTPKVWQKRVPGVSSPSGPARKRELAEQARRLFPGVKLTQENADALLIADWARREGV